ncbi:hypothetical protein [Methylobacter sp. S3L5C]|uniref:hypothetical protein n=1 Tax=Methylobacter sp. S3L5C TaxID=2839024 RepID=UPI001FAB8E90|nr:hypothetical protein [Methylobacter sp. S3L5C]UOA07163.1 hypothetical protein KKZ03_12705 [Methylobacter sp. S3L5C]
MLRKLKHAIASAWILGNIFILPGIPAFAESLGVDEVLRVLGMDKGQIAELAQGEPVAYALSEGSADELAVGLTWYLPVSLDKVAGQLRLEDPDPLDVDVKAHGLLTEHSGAGSLAPVVLSKEEAQALLNAEPGDEFNLSAHEIDKLKVFKQTLKRTPQRAIEDAAGEHFREILLQRYEAYRRGGTNAIAPYARKESTAKPSLELRQAANANAILSHYFPALHKVWLDYPKALPPGASEVFPWVEKNVEGRSATILRHRINMDWNGGILVLTREIYAPHSYNSSQWITGSLPYRGGTVVFQQVRSFTDQVTGVASNVKHIVGRELLKDKMIKSFDRLCSVLGQCN